MSFGEAIEPLPITEDSEILLFEENSVYPNLFTLTISKVQTTKIQVTLTPGTATPALVPVGTQSKPTYIPTISFTVFWLTSLNIDLDSSTLTTSYGLECSDRYTTIINNISYDYRIFYIENPINATSGWPANTAVTLLTIEPDGTGLTGTVGSFNIMSLPNDYISPDNDSSLIFNVNPLVVVFDYTNIINRKYKPIVTGTATNVPLD